MRWSSEPDRVQKPGDLISNQVALRNQRFGGQVNSFLVDIHEPPVVDIGRSQKLRYDAASPSVVQDRAGPSALYVNALRYLGHGNQLFPDVGCSDRHLRIELIRTHADGPHHGTSHSGRHPQVSKNATCALAIKNMLTSHQPQAVPEFCSHLGAALHPLFFGRHVFVVASDLSISCRTTSDRKPNMRAISLEEVRGNGVS